MFKFLSFDLSLEMCPVLWSSSRTDKKTTTDEQDKDVVLHVILSHRVKSLKISE